MDEILIDPIDNNLEINETLLDINNNLNNIHLDIVNNSINTLEISIIFIGLFIGLLLSIIFGVVAFND